ncbi:hypothetical protein CPB85DRAFT_1253924 [Mucidula mucida]|nr:hypothetical protein CPB85DRAFT_1253924 [Mucidula mucida]
MDKQPSTNKQSCPFLLSIFARDEAAALQEMVPVFPLLATATSTVKLASLDWCITDPLPSHTGSGCGDYYKPLIPLLRHGALDYYTASPSNKRLTVAWEETTTCNQFALLLVEVGRQEKNSQMLIPPPLAHTPEPQSLLCFNTDSTLKSD